jgi:hypothetical protein
MSKHYSDSKHLLMMVGAGFNFEKAELYLQQIQETARQFNDNNQDIKIYLSTLSFFDRAMSSHRGDFPVSYQDRMALTQDGMFYHSGLFTSRQNLKSYIRRASQVYHVASKMYHGRMLDYATLPKLTA